MENKYPEGATVFAKEAPARSLTVRRYAKRIYYCTDPAQPLGKDQVYYERELMQHKTETGQS
ncbi:hypothetical protein H8S95_16805 [Pontibacter sp. KCTC 32443]|uniref:hypothetical protein n=1 Tax=Pontibacter TaxID=323449 RepID=UPI00164ECF21|nr:MULTISPECIES: hypothetical protein [Pontibacter]MBC5775740.1 hypothetical protein [Pontibacter sp. KCTC 32443]